MKWLLRSVLMTVLTLLSYTQAMAFESPSGYVSAGYSVSYSYNTEPIEPMPVKLVETQANFDNLLTWSIPSGDDSYTTLSQSLKLPAGTGNIERGYTKVLFS